MLTISVVLILLLFGCAMEENPLFDETIYGQITYDFDTMTFTNTSLDDIFYEVGNPWDDFIIMYKTYYGTSIDPTELIAYEALFVKLINLSVASSVTVGTITHYSTEQLNTILEGYAIDLSLTDVIMFNSLKTILNGLRTQEDLEIVISKISYLQVRLSVILTEDQIEHLDMLQDYYLSNRNMDDMYYLKDSDFDTFITRYESTGITISEIAKENLLEAFNLMKSL
jgi:hypothetical protein